ncbi:MAG: LemA family protein [Thermoguttaceae bacterium]
MIWCGIAIAGIVTLLAFYCAHAAYATKRLIDDIPTSKINGVYIGLVEVKGTAESPNPFTSYLAAVPCVAYKWQVEEEWRRVVMETRTDAKGNTTTTSRVESGWETIASGEERERFYLRDDTGVLRVNSEAATETRKSVFSQTVTPSDNLYYTKGPQETIANSTQRRRFSEVAIPLHHELYVLGPARYVDEDSILEITREESLKSDPYLISTEPEDSVSSSRGWAYFGWHFLGVVAATAFACCVTATLNPNIVNGAIADWIPAVLAGVGGYILLATIGWLYTVQCSLISLKNRVRTAFSNIDVQLKRRSDLIPRLVSCVQGIASHERDVQTGLAKLRSQVEPSSGNVEGCAATLRAIVESYPQIASQGNFLLLQKELANTEQKIALARAYYNDIVTNYNTRLAIFPDGIVAKLTALHPAELFNAAGLERKNPEIVFA